MRERNILFINTIDFSKTASMHLLRYQIVMYAITHSKKAAARHYRCDIKTIRRWVARFISDPDTPLEDATRASTHHPHRMEYGTQLRLFARLEERFNTHSRIIISKIKAQFHFSYSEKCIRTYAKKWGFYHTRCTKKKLKKNLVETKKQYAFCQKIQVDIKYLTDIAELHPSLRSESLPKYQITARELSTGALWFAFAREKSSTNTALYMRYLLSHLSAHGVNTRDITIQTDNGSEFVTQYYSQKSTSFQDELASFHVAHRTIPLGKPTYNSDVVLSSGTERKPAYHNIIKLIAVPSHRLIEDEHYSNLNGATYSEFLIASELYQKYFNLARNNSYRGGSPLKLLQQKNITVDSHVLVLKPIVIDNVLLHPHTLKEINIC